MVTDPDTPRVGWIASGVMGASMAAHLIDAGYATTLTTRTQEEARRPEGHSCPWAETPAQLLAPGSLEWSRSAAT